MVAATTRVLVDGRMASCEVIGFCGGRLALFSAPRPDREGRNEDAALASDLGSRAVLAVADGAGGEAGGARASAAAVEALRAGVEGAGPDPLRETILGAFDGANTAVSEFGIGAATTLAVVEMVEGTVRTYHVGDSFVLVVGQRGKRKLETIAHSPVGYAVEAGVLDEHEALHHEERHVVSNLVGTPGMRVEMSARLRLSPRDTLVLASDGLSDNLHVEELVELVRKGPLDKAAARLAAAASERMRAPRETLPSKPDDLTFLVFRP